MQKTVWARIRLPMPKLSPSDAGEQSEEGERRHRGDDLRHHQRQVDDHEGGVWPRHGLTRVVPIAASVAIRLSRRWSR